jgi:hypothetical protein
MKQFSHHAQQKEAAFVIFVGEEIFMQRKMFHVPLALKAPSISGAKL